MIKKLMAYGLLVSLVCFVAVSCSPARNTSNWQFSADSVTKVGGMTQKATTYVDNGKWRMEAETPGGKMITFVREDKKVVWLLMPDQKMYMEQALSEEQMAMTKADKLPGEIKRENQGKETMNGVECIKYMVAYKPNPNGPELSIYQWLTKDNIPVKMSDVNGKWTSEYVNLKRGKQDASLFEIPEGFKKLETQKQPQSTQ